LSAVLPATAAILAAALVGALAAPPAPLLHPIDGPSSVTSTFGTYRIGHHHAGIDLATGGREDLVVRAAAAGDIVRIERRSTGFGRSVYVRHPDGRTTVYAHLSAFAPALDARVHERARPGRFSVRLRPSPPIPVARGEALGWVGTSGTDLVHLHFEVRRGGRPVDPLTAGLVLEDTQPPRPTRLYAVPTGPDAHVAHAFDAVLRPVDEPTPLVLGGAVDLYIEIEDRIDGGARALEPSRFEARIDGGDPVTARRYDRLEYATGYAVDLDYHPRLRAEGIGRFHRLDVGPLPVGPHTLTVDAWDAAGNHGRGTVALQVEARRDPCPGPSRDGARIIRGSTLLWPRADACRHPGRRTRLGDAVALVFPLPPAADGRIEVAGEIVRTQRFRAGATLTSGPFALTVGADAVFEPFHVEAITASAPPVAGLDVRGPLHGFSQGWAPVRGRSAVSWSGPGDLYLVDGDRWWWLGASTGETVRPVLFGKARDIAPPTVGEPRWDAHPAGPRLLVPVADAGSGLEAVQGWVDDRPIALERQSGHGRVVWRPRGTPERATLRVLATDHAGQRTERSIAIGPPDAAVSPP
jgi:hypothetical protein